MTPDGILSQTYAVNCILKGRKEIARIARVSTGVLDQLIDRGILPVSRWGHGPQGTIYTTTKLVIEAIETNAKRQQKRQI